MSLAFIISLAIQVTLIVHCIRTGRNWLWMLAIGLLPVAGSVAYVLVEVLPDLFRGRGTRRAVRGVRRALDPEQDLRRFEAEARTIGDVIRISSPAIVVLAGTIAAGGVSGKS